MTLLDRILALTAAIEAHVADGNWPGAAALDRERRTLLAELLAAQPGALDGVARGVLEELLARNRATLAQAEQQRQELGAALRTLTDSPAAVRAYTRAGPARALAPAGTELP